MQDDLVRVLTHGVMNSLTPAPSLAGTAARLIGEVDPAASPAVGKALRAIDALARRAWRLERFVDDYLHHAEAIVGGSGVVVRRGRTCLFASTPVVRGVRTNWPGSATLETVPIDRGLMTQVVFDPLKNAGEVVTGRADAAIRGEATNAGGRFCISIVDNGPGLDPAIAADVFLPFFTTRAESSGIGLSLARRIGQLHGGRIDFTDGDETEHQISLPCSLYQPRDFPRLDRQSF